MKRINILAIIMTTVLVIAAVVFLGWYFTQEEKKHVIVQGTIECASYKASSKIAGRIEDMKVKQGQHVERGELLYVLSTPELDAKLQQAQAVQSAAYAMDEKALQGARKQQIEAAMNLWQQARAGLDLATKTYERVQNLFNEGVVPAQKLDEARANYDAMVASESAAKAQYELVLEGAGKEDKAAAAAQLRQAQGAVSEVESYLKDAMVYSPAAGEVSTVVSEQGELVGSGYPVVTILDLTDVWATFNIKETMLPKIKIGTRMTAYVPALDRNVEFEVTFISAQADFATWNATRTQGGFDVRTFAVKAKPVDGISDVRPGMSVLVDWDTLQ
ncbi:MAG: HlyD family secretion protein [Alistipes sp.]|nr:HlyD family secretion protein [Alistipes sp.]